MERSISQEERIRRAEEIYNRRKSTSNTGVRVSGSSVNTSRNRLSLFRKMAMQLAICSIIYIIFYLIKNSDYIFSEDVIKKTKEMLSYDINFGKVYSSISTFIQDNKDKLKIPGITAEQNNENVNEIINDTTNTEATNQVQSNDTNDNSIKEEKNNNQVGGIGGTEPKNVKQTSADEEKPQMEKDADYVKKNYKLSIPLKGTITSRYGAREKTEIVSANHQGIDIGANTGTIIYAAMDGTVTLTSEKGDYRKTCRNNKWKSYD